jgi:hypothetical protein
MTSVIRYLAYVTVKVLFAAHGAGKRCVGGKHVSKYARPRFAADRELFKSLTSGTPDFMPFLVGT